MAESDENLISLIIKGDHSAFSEIVARHTARYFALAYRSLQNKPDAEDVIQSCFIKLWQKPHLWDAKKSSFTTWFYRVVINTCHDHRRRHKTILEFDDNLHEPGMVCVASEQQLLEGAQNQRLRQRCLEIGISKLPASQRDALNLVVYCELPQKHAAEILGISLKAVESRLVRAKWSLAQYVNKQLGRNNQQHAAELLMNDQVKITMKRVT